MPTKTLQVPSPICLEPTNFITELSFVQASEMGDRNGKSDHVCTEGTQERYVRRIDADNSVPIQRCP
jgi:hypothetical protein